MASDLDDLVSHTPATRDRSVDFLRAASIGAVVFGHWLIGVIRWKGGIVRATSAIGQGHGLWFGTWLFQVMGIFFFVGGFANAVAFDAARRRSVPAATFIRSRVARLLRPSLVFLGAWAAAQLVLHLTDRGTPTGPGLWGSTRLLRGVRPPGAMMPFGPLWFLGVYLVIVIVCPVTIALHHRFGWWVVAVLIGGAVAADAIGFAGGHPAVRYANVVFVLLTPHQLGHVLASGGFDGWPRRRFAAVALIGIALLVTLTNPWLWRVFGDRRFDWFPGIGHYPRSLLGTDVEVISNAYPPTLCFLAQCLWTIAAVMVARPALQRWLQRPAPWKATIAVNTMIMTLFLWHMTAYLLAVLVLWPLGFGRETTASARWWAERPLWVTVPGAFLAVLVAVFSRFERPRLRPRAG